MKTASVTINTYSKLCGLFYVAANLVAGFTSLAAENSVLTLHTRHREPVSGNTNEWNVTEKAVQWGPKQTALIICDMWDKHWCPDATERVGEMAPVMNRVVAKAREDGVLIIHCPSDTMNYYKDFPGRKLAQSAPKVETKVPLKGWCSLQGQSEPPLPIDDSDEGCDGCPDCPTYRAWSHEHSALEIKEGDAITDSVDAFYLMRQRGITNVIVMGVHANMCVLGRPFSIRQMVAQGQNVVLMRDMTDAMYHHRSRPYVSHFRGTEMVVEHIEKYWCPSITSVDFLGGEPFHFKEDKRKNVAMIIGENEYRTWETLPDFARHELEWRGVNVSYVMASTNVGANEFTNYQAIANADLLLVSVRRRTPPRAMMDLIRAHIAAGKPVVGIRTACHAFDAKVPDEEHAAWPTFGKDIFGAEYQNHYGAGPQSLLQTISANRSHPVLIDLPSTEFSVVSSLYKNRNPAPTVTTLIQGHVEGNSQIEPVAWVNTANDRRVFYTELGSPDDFKMPVFRRLLLNGILWALAEPIPPAEVEKSKVTAKKVEPTIPKPAPVTAAAKPAPTVVDLPQEANASPQTSAESVKHFKVTEDLDWEQLLAEPTIAQPVFLNFDPRGRMWVVEYRQYPSPAGLKMVSHDSVWRSVYDKVPPPPPHHFPGKDKITIHEDTDGDGTFDKHTTFVDGLNIVTAVERGRGGVWVLNPPYLLFYRDANQDDIPDGDPEVRLSGFGLEDTHSVVNSLRWGPDGWLYGAQGSTVTANIIVHAADGSVLNSKPIFSQGQNIWRYHPEKRLYEVFAEGGGNAFGCEIDSQGRIFSGHNGGDTRGFYYVQGGYLQKGFEKHGPLSNPYAFGFFPPMPHPSVPRFTHNFLIYDSGALPEQYAGKLFGAEPLQGRIVESEITPDQSSFRTRDISWPVTSDDRWFRPVDIKLGPDGAIYVCDWYDQQVNHFRNHEGRMDASNGRIYRLKAKGGAPIRNADLTAYSSDALVSALTNQNRWIRQTALRLLADRRDSSVVPKLEENLVNARGQLALESLWALNLTTGLSESATLKLLDHPDPFVRSWTTRLLCDDKKVATTVAAKLVQVARNEPDLEVRNQLAASARRLPAEQCLAIVGQLLTHDVDAHDNRMPLMLWWAIESKCETNRDEVVRFFQDPSLWKRPLVEQHLLDRVMRRFAQAGTRKDLVTCAQLFELSQSPEETRRLMAGFEAGFQGRSMAGLPDELLVAMSRHGSASLALRVRQGDATALTKALRVIRDETSPKSERIELLGVLANIKSPTAVYPLVCCFRGAFHDNEIRKAAMAALQLYDDPIIADAVIDLYARLSPDALSSAQVLLASRSAWSAQFVDAIEHGRLKSQTVPLNIVRKMHQYSDPKLGESVQKLWPSVSRVHTTASMEGRIHHLAEVVQSGFGDPYSGRTLFQNTCATCHRLFGNGGQIGPDLTTYKRDDLDSMLLSIVNPSAEIREGFENYSIETKDGRSLSGFLAEQDNQRIVLRGLDGQNTTMSRSDLLELKAAGLSLMPEGLLDGFDDQQARDLFAYLRSTQPLVGGFAKP
ncbi:MAG: hypothetical protein JWM99_3494 [Verrucomicrobiales bacterium]|nr:hypothetical protein [Verrucomicrobiales bacterium]